VISESVEVKGENPGCYISSSDTSSSSYSLEGEGSPSGNFDAAISMGKELSHII
jgi:hypothetical protein